MAAEVVGRSWAVFWVPAFAGTTVKYRSFFLVIPANAGTQKQPKRHDRPTH